MKKMSIYKRLQVVFVVFWISLATVGWAESINITDDVGNQIRLDEPPRQVVSLMPSATEIIFAVGAGDALAGITYHSTAIAGAADKTIVGGFFSPSANHVMSLKPDLIIVSSFHDKFVEQLHAEVPILVLNTLKMNDAFRHIQLIGDLFHRELEASELMKKIQRQLDLIARKVAEIPEKKRKRVMRLMGREQIMTLGNDSFQNEIIRAAGGIAPDFGKSGSVVPVTREEFMRFNPQIIYGCGDDAKAADFFFSQEGWCSVAAVKNHRIYSFPCDLTCRAGVHLGDFVSWLSSMIYTDEFSDADQELLSRKVIHTQPIRISLDYVQDAEIATSILHDFESKSLIINFRSPMAVVSTLEGQRQGVLTVGNHYSPPPCWALNHSCSIKELRANLYSVIGKTAENASFLFTGANMDNLAVKKETFKEMTVYALVTAGVRGNAVRMGTDTGNYYEPGTINMIFLTNMKLSPRAMTRAIISATEGKTAALQDLDIRSTYQPLTAAATGTGTDNILLVEGNG